MSKPIIGRFSTVQTRYKRTTDTRNLVTIGPVFPWYQRALGQVFNMLSAVTRGV